MAVAMFDSGCVAAKAITEEPCYATDRSNTDACLVVDAAIGKAFLQQANDLPAIDQRLQFRRRAQVFEKIATFGQALQLVHRTKKGVFIAFSLAVSVVSVGFHGFLFRDNVLM